MKKKFSLAACALALALAFTGCSAQFAEEYDETSLTTSCEEVFSIIQSGSIAGEDITSMSDWNQGYLMAQLQSQTGIQMDAEDLVTALDGWEAAQEECGAYEGHGEFKITETSTSVTVRTEGQFAERTADLVFTFDENLQMDAFTVEAHYDMGEIMQKAGLNTLLGMGTVFAVLMFMSLIISLIKYIPALLERPKKKETKMEAPEIPAARTAPEPEPVMETAPEDDTELVAVIAAAIAASEGTTPDGFVVRSIKRRKSNKWNA